MDIIKVKANIICHGLLENELSSIIYNHQNPNSMKKQGRYYGIMIKLNDSVSLLANVCPNVSGNVKYKLSGSLESLILTDLNGNFICDVTFINPPKWYDKKTSTNKNTSEIFIDEGENYLHMTYNGCDYTKCGLKCKFCGVGERFNESISDEIAEVVSYAEKERDYHVCLGGGTYLPLKRNVEHFKDIVSKIRKKSKSIPIWLEMVPPNKEEIKELVDAGVTSFGFNIEVFDAKLRKEICPGKSAIPIDEYIKRGKYANELLGGNKVGSTLICGIAPLNTIFNGIDELTKNGIHPCILAFRPTDNSEYKDKKECDDKDFYEASLYAARKILENNLDVFKNEGCLKCEYCTIIHDLIKDLKAQKNLKNLKKCV